MGFEETQLYLASGWRDFINQVIFNWQSVLDVFSLGTFIDLVLVITLLWWLWRQLKSKAIMTPIIKLVVWLGFAVFAKILGLSALFYVMVVVWVMMIIMIAINYQQDIRKLLDDSFGYKLATKQAILSSDFHAGRFINELVSTVMLLAKSKIPSVLVIRTTEPLSRLISTGIQLNTPFKQDLILDIFSRRSKLSSGAMLVDRGLIMAAGATLIIPAPKRFSFTVRNIALQEVARRYHALVVITYKDREEVSVLHGENSYAKLSVKNLDRVLKNILPH
ncbi:MAG: diadenylate cyclase [Patescibacteria group bacterium]|nr:diadenylate cyclase [Patescibacteria group bacterium]